MARASLHNLLSGVITRRTGPLYGKMLSHIVEYKLSWYFRKGGCNEGPLTSGKSYFQDYIRL